MRVNKATIVFAFLHLLLLYESKEYYANKAKKAWKKMVSESEKINDGTRAQPRARAREN